MGSQFFPVRQYNKDEPNKFRVDFFVLADCRPIHLSLGCVPRLEQVLGTYKGWVPVKPTEQDLYLMSSNLTKIQNKEVEGQQDSSNCQHYHEIRGGAFKYCPLQQAASQGGYVTCFKLIKWEFYSNASEKVIQYVDMEDNTSASVSNNGGYTMDHIPT
eukprot:5802771-Ditylum_brightwellii.AAC.1